MKTETAKTMNPDLLFEAVANLDEMAIQKHGEGIFKLGGSQKIVEQVRAKALKEVQGLDVNKAAGRKDIKSVAYTIARTKTTLDGMGKVLDDQLKAQREPIKKERDNIKDQLNILKEEILQPVYDWDNKENNRKAALVSRVGELQLLAAPSLGQGEGAVTENIQIIKGNIEQLEGVVIDYTFEEYTADAAKSQVEGLEALKVLLSIAEEAAEMAEQRRKNDIELAEFREMKAKQEQEAIQQRIKEAAEEKEKARLASIAATSQASPVPDAGLDTFPDPRLASSYKGIDPAGFDTLAPMPAGDVVEIEPPSFFPSPQLSDYTDLIQDYIFSYKAGNLSPLEYVTAVDKIVTDMKQLTGVY